MAAIDELVSLIGHNSGLDLTKMSPEQLVTCLDDDTVLELLAPILAEEDHARFNRFALLFPDEGPLRRELYQRHLEFFRAGLNYRERCFLAANRVGKAQPNDEPVLTPSGWRKMGDLVVGDMLIGSNGSPTRIKGVYPQGNRQIVKLSASDGSSTRCDLDHLWSVRPVKHGRAAPYQTLTARELQQRVGAGERWMLPERSCVEFEAACELPADPYLIGILLGDGGLSTDRVLLSSEDDEIVSYAKDQATKWGCELRHAGGCTWHFATLIKRGGRHHNVLRAVLDGLGLAGKTSHHKRIPSQYLFAMESDRLALLQGLMDTDGSCSNTNGVRMFYSVNKALCEDVAALARSLGMNASVKPKNGRYKGKAHRSWLTHIALSERSIFRLERKAARERFAGRRMRGVMIESIDLDGEAECTCVEVEAEDHLYVTKDFLVTHNTVAGGYECSAHLTGMYPHWWEGYRFRYPIRAWAAGDTNETTRDIIQLELLGNVVAGSDGRKGLDGSGLIPRECIGQPKWKQGVQDLVDTIPILHSTGGWSTISFKSFDQGRRSFQGTSKELIWLDEECPEDVYNECLIRTMTTRGRVLNTFTPLNGLTEHVLQFLPGEMRPGGS